MILEYSIENTLSIREKQTVSFEAVKSAERSDFDSLHVKKIGDKEILKVACIYGSNAAGKTNMVYALKYYLNFMLNSFFDLKPDESTHFYPFKFNEKFQSEPGRFNLVFYAPLFNNEKNIKYDYSISLNQKDVIEESLYYSPNGQKSLVFYRLADGSVKWGPTVKGPKKNAEEMLRGNISLISVGTQANVPILNSVYNHLSKRLKTNKNNNSFFDDEEEIDRIDDDQKFKEKVLGLLSATDFGSISDIKVETTIIDDSQLPESIRAELSHSGKKMQLKNAFFVHSYHDKNYSLPIVWESKGTRKLLKLANPISFVPDSVLIIEDELDSSLHPDLVEALIKLFVNISDDSQIIFTSHNTDLLESGFIRDDEVWFCYKTDEGNTLINSITDYTGIRSETSRRKLYKAGKFGALPVIDNDLLKELFCAKTDEKEKN